MKIITIIDWDDTLFPTTWIISNKIKHVHLTELDNNICNLFIKLINKSDIYIVSNALPEWINQSLEYIPKTREFIHINKIPIRYARLEYNGDNILYAKIPVFKNIYLSNLHYSPLHIIAIGDDQYEYLALKQLTKHPINKSITFIFIKQQSSYKKLINQLKYISNNLNKYIYR